MFLDIIHRPVCISNAILFFYLKHVSEAGFCLRLQVKLTQLGPISRLSLYLRIWKRRQNSFSETLCFK
jgi:hypothetical protein